MEHKHLVAALEAFKTATADLDRIWSGADLTGDEIANYPACLPSFDEFAASVAEMSVRPSDILDLDEIARLIRLAGIPAYVEQTGGGCATLYAGEPRETDDLPVYPAVAGPGWFEGPGNTKARAHRDEFSAGTDENAPDGGRVALPVADLDERQIADALVTLAKGTEFVTVVLEVPSVCVEGIDREIASALPRFGVAGTYPGDLISEDVDH